MSVERRRPRASMYLPRRSQALREIPNDVMESRLVFFSRQTVFAQVLIKILMVIKICHSLPFFQRRFIFY